MICNIIYHHKAMPTGRYPHPRLELDETKKTGKLTIPTSSTHQMIPPSQISIRTINSTSSSSSIEPPTINRQYSKPTSLRRSWSSSLLSPTTQYQEKQLPTINEDASYTSDKCYSSSYCWCCFPTPDVCDIQLILPSFIGRSETRTTNNRKNLYEI